MPVVPSSWELPLPSEVPTAPVDSVEELLSPVDSEEELIDKINSIIMDKEKVKTMGRNSLEEIRWYTFESMAYAHIKFMHNLTMLEKSE